MRGSEALQKAWSVIRSRFNPRKLLFVTYVCTLLYFTAVFVGYGLAWMHFGRTPVSVLSSGGRSDTGVVESYKPSGLGPGRNYKLKMLGKQEEYIVASEIVNPTLGDRVYASIDIDRLVTPGEEGYVGTSGGIPYVLDLVIKRKNGTSKRILSYGESANRFRNALKQAPEIGTQNLLFGIAILPIGLIAWALATYTTLGSRMIALTAKWIGRIRHN